MAAPPTAAQQRQLQLHRFSCQAMGIPQATLEHKHLKGTITPSNAQGNQIYKGPGPITTFDAQVAQTFKVWWVHQPFVRGEQRPQEESMGIMATQLEESQCPAITDDGEIIQISADDFIIDAMGWVWKIMDPVISPDLGYWTFMTDRQR